MRPSVQCLVRLSRLILNSFLNENFIDNDMLLIIIGSLIEEKKLGEIIYENAEEAQEFKAEL